MQPREAFRVHVAKDYLKFSAAHFIAYHGFREALHGHNYRVSVNVTGSLGSTGYVVDFGVVKRLARGICQRLDEKLLLPAASDCLKIDAGIEEVVIVSDSGSFSIPRSDCVLLPLVHSSAEELARYFAVELRGELERSGADCLSAVEVGIEETSGQAAYYCDQG